MKFRRLLPVLLLLGTFVVGASRGPQMLARMQGFVHSKLQRGELADIAKLLRADVAESKTLPRPGRPDELAKYLNENRKGEEGRDLTLDRWQHPFVLERDGTNLLVLRSLGVDGVHDKCTNDGEETAEMDDICESIDLTPPDRR